MDTSSRSRPPAPWLAIVLGLLCTGLGQMYCGRLRRGLTFFLLALLLGPNVLWFVAQPPSGGTLVALLVSVGLAAFLLVASTVDAALLATRLRRTGQGAPPLGFAITTLFVVVSLLSPAATALVLRATTVEAFKIAGASMAPGLSAGDRILVDKVGLRYGLPARGEVIVFRSPEDGRAFVKRVIGIEGDHLEIRSGELHLNGAPVPQTPAPGDAARAIERLGERSYAVIRLPGEEAEDGAWTVPPAHVFVIGDNRGAAMDSRRFGPVPRSAIVGVAACLFWPPSRLGDPVP